MIGTSVVPSKCPVSWISDIPEGRDMVQECEWHITTTAVCHSRCKACYQHSIIHPYDSFSYNVGIISETLNLNFFPRLLERTAIDRRCVISVLVEMWPFCWYKINTEYFANE
jgi:hypothetical protein